MKTYTLLYTIPALLAVPAAFADISHGQTAHARNIATAQGAYHSDLLASNAVLAVLKEIRTVPKVTLEATTPETEQIAVFEVKQNLAHRRYDRMGDGPLQPGKLFSVSLATDVPGQDAALADKIRAMAPGDEAVMNMDHIYVFREEGNENVRACTRFATAADKQDAPATPSAPTSAPAAVSHPTAPAADAPGAPAPFGGAFHITMGPDTYSSSVSTSIEMKPDAQGVMRRTKVVIRREISGNKETVRKFINDVEVDPQTDQPLTPPTDQTTPTPTPPTSED